MSLFFKLTAGQMMDSVCKLSWTRCFITVTYHGLVAWWVIIFSQKLPLEFFFFPSWMHHLTNNGCQWWRYDISFLLTEEASSSHLCILAFIEPCDSIYAFRQQRPMTCPLFWIISKENMSLVRQFRTHDCKIIQDFMNIFSLDSWCAWSYACRWCQLLALGNNFSTYCFHCSSAE